MLFDLVRLKKMISLNFVSSVFWVFWITASVEGRKQTLITCNTALLDNLGQNAHDEVLALGIPSRTTRRDAIIQELKKPSTRRADLLCLQEVWFAEDVYKITEELKFRYPYSYSKVHDDSGTVPSGGVDTQPPCPVGDFLALGYCMQMHSCTTATSVWDVAKCVITNCVIQLVSLPDQCWTCFLTSFTTVDNVLYSCTDAIPTGIYRKINKPGLVLLSRRPLQDPSYTDLHPGTREVLERGYLHAQVNGRGDFSSESRDSFSSDDSDSSSDRSNFSSDVSDSSSEGSDSLSKRDSTSASSDGDDADFDVVCTHTTMYNEDVYFELELASNFSSFTEQGIDEITKLIDAFSGLKKVFLFGDFNVGRGTGSSLEPIQPEYFDMLSKAFSVDPIQKCTFCNSPENIYNGNHPSQMIDHIFTKGFKPTILQPRFGTSKTIRNWENIVVYFPVIARADNQL